MSSDWNNLNVKEKIMLVTTDILDLLDSLCEKTKAGGELESVIEAASESFEPLGEILQINVKEDDKSVNLNAVAQSILSGHSIITPEVAQLLGASLKLAARTEERHDDNKSSSISGQSEQISLNAKRTDKLDSRNSRRLAHSVVEKRSSKRSPVKDLSQPGPSGLQLRRKDVSMRDMVLKQRFRSLLQLQQSGTSSEETMPRQDSEDSSPPDSSRVRTSFKQAARYPEKTEGNKSLLKSRSEQVHHNSNKKNELPTQLGLSDSQTKRRDVSVREQFSKKDFRSASRRGPSSEESSDEGRPRHRSESKSKVIRKDTIPENASVDQSETNISKRKHQSFDSKRTHKSSSVYKSYTHYNPDEWETESDESENEPRRSSTVY